MDKDKIKGPVMALCVLIAILIIVVIWNPRGSSTTSGTSPTTSSQTPSISLTGEKASTAPSSGSGTTQTTNSCSGKMATFQAQTYARYTQTAPRPTITGFAVAYSSVLRTCVGTYYTVTFPDGDTNHSLTQYSIVNLSSGQQLSGLPGMSGSVYIVDLNPAHAANHYQDYVNELSYLTGGALR